MSVPAEEIKATLEDAAAVVTPTTETPAEEAPAENQTDSDLWSGMADDLESQDTEGEPSNESEVVVTPVEEIPAADATPASEPAVVETPVETPVVPEIPAAETTPPETPVTETPPQTPVAETPPAATEEVKTPEQLQADRVAQQAKNAETRSAAIDQLAESYKLSDEEATGFLTKPEEVVPKFAARLFMDVYDAVVTNLMQNMPDVVNNINKQTETQNAAETAFYSANPLLDMSNAQHKQLVNTYGQTYMNVNKEATAADFQRDVGIQVMYALGINPAPVTPTPAVTTETIPPHTPAGASSVPAGNTAPVDENGWGAIAESLMEDEES